MLEQFIVVYNKQLIQQMHRQQRGEQRGFSVRQQEQELGSIKVNNIIYIVVPAVLLTPLYTYYMAVSNNQQPPYPHATITNTACHYPQAIIFRLIMLSAASFISLIYFVIGRWISYQKKRIQYPGSTHTWLIPLAQVSALGQMAAIGTIDTAGYPDLHTIGAVFFFIVLFLMVFIYTSVLRSMHRWNPTVLSRSSYIVKSFLVLYITLVALFCLVGLISQAIPGSLTQDDRFVVIIEWNLLEICLLWLLSFVGDWTQLTITLYKSGKAHITNRI